MAREWTSPDGRMRLINGCCMDFMRGCRDGEFSLACVDPPYGIGMDGQCESKSATGRQYRPAYEKKGWDSAIPVQAYFDDLMRVSGQQIIWGGNLFPLPVNRGWIFWYKMQNDLCMGDGELAWTSFDKVIRQFSLHRTHLWQEKPIHPTQKPVALYRWLFQNYAKAGDRILDTHVGSASSFIAAWEKGFEIVGCELDGDYFDAAVARIEKAMQQPALPFDTPPTKTQHTAQELF